MNRWLAEESKWARERAIKTRTQIDEMSDPAWRTRRLAMIRREETHLAAAVERHFELVSERALLEDPTALSDTLRRMGVEADQWERIAAEQSARLERTEDEQESLIPSG